MQPVLDAELARHRDHGPALDGVDLTPGSRPRQDVSRRATADGHRAPRRVRRPASPISTPLPSPTRAGTCWRSSKCHHVACGAEPPRSRRPRPKPGSDANWSVEPSIDEVVLRYLGAFGPATVADVSSWSRLTGMREVVERLRPRLRVFRDERGRELFDLPDAPRPDPDTPAPSRFLPEYDNVLLSHADRSRFVRDDRRGQPWTAPIIHGTVLHDGTIAGTWHIERDPAQLARRHSWSCTSGLSARAQASVTTEGRRFLALPRDWCRRRTTSA